MRRTLARVSLIVLLVLAVAPASSASPVRLATGGVSMWRFVERLWSCFEAGLGKARGMMDPDGRLYLLQDEDGDFTASTD